MAESQNIEYNEFWRDEYLKLACGFANDQGGTIDIDELNIDLMLIISRCMRAVWW